MTENDNFFYAFAANPGFIAIPTVTSVIVGLPSIILCNSNILWARPTKTLQL